jgi:hypothetical protein
LANNYVSEILALELMFVAKKILIWINIPVIEVRRSVRPIFFMRVVRPKHGIYAVRISSPHFTMQLDSWRVIQSFCSIEFSCADSPRKLATRRVLKLASFWVSQPSPFFNFIFIIAELLTWVRTNASNTEMSIQVFQNGALQ